MGQGASAAGHDSELRHDGAGKQRHSKHRRSTRSLPDAALIRTTPANYQNGGRSNAIADGMNVTTSVSSSSMAFQQQSSRRAGVSTNNGVGPGHGITIGTNSANPTSTEQYNRDQESMMKKYMHRDAAPYYVSTKAKTTCGPRSLDISFRSPWAENVHRYQKSSSKTRFDDNAAGSSNWSDVASDMFRISKHHQDSADRSISDVQSDFVPTAGTDRHGHRQNRGSSKRCQQQKKSRRSEKQDQDQPGMTGGERRQQRHESGEPDGEPVSGRLHYRDCSGLMMTPVPENPYKEHQEYRQQKEDEEKMERRRENGGIVVTKRSRSVHDCASTKRGQLQPPSHPPPRPPKGKLHYYARLENDASEAASAAQGNGSLVEQWIDFPTPQHGQNVIEASPNRSVSTTDTPTPRSPGSSECDKLVIQSLRAELSAERSLRVDAERRCKNNDKEVEANRQRIRQLESDVQKMVDSINDMKRQREEEAALTKKKMEELTEKCRQLSDDLRRSVEETRQAELRCDQEKSNYEEYMDNVANQVGQALTRQQTMKSECGRLQKRVLEVEWENKVLKAQLRLTPMWASNANGMILANGNGYPAMPSTATGSSASSVSNKTDFGRFAHVADHQNNNASQVGVIYRRKSFREKMAGLHRYRQSMGSDPTLDQSIGAGNVADEIPLLSIESLASFNEESDQFPPYDDLVTVSNAQIPIPSASGRHPHQQGSFHMFNAGEGLCSRPASFNFDSPAGLSARPGQCQGNGPTSKTPHHPFANGNLGHSSIGGNHCFNKVYVAGNHEEIEEEDDEPVKNYAAMFGEEGFLSSLPPVAPLLPPSVPGAGAVMSTPIFNAVDPTAMGRHGGRERSDQNNDNRDSSTETLNAGSNSQPNGNFFADSPKRKLDVVVNMLTSFEMRNPFSPTLWPSTKGQDEKKWKMNQFSGLPGTGLFRDDGYSTMSSELYAVFDNSLLSRMKSSRNSVTFPPMTCEMEKAATPSPSRKISKIGRSSSDGELNERNRIERRILKRNEPSLNLDTFERDYATLLSADGDEPGDGLMDQQDQSVRSNREALCDLDIASCIPALPISGDYFLSMKPAPSANTASNRGSNEHCPPDPPSVPAKAKSEKCNSTVSSDQKTSTVGKERQRPALKPRLHRRKPTRASRLPSHSDDSTTTEDSDAANGTVIEVSRSRRVGRLINASTSSTSTSFTSDDEDNSRLHVDEGARTTMQIWLRQLKIKRAGQKSGLVRYMPPECRPSILRAGVFARFGMDERRALASFDFLHQFEQLEPPAIKRKAKSRSITDLYENLPYHERTGTVSGTGGNYFSRSRCSSRVSFAGCGSLSTLTSVPAGERGLASGRSYSSSLFLSDFCNDDDNCSSSTSNSSLSFTFQ